jgi:tryptophan 2,3-dioxygenase
MGHMAPWDPGRRARPDQGRWSYRGPVTDPAATYTGYLRVDDLLDLQHPRSDEHDEVLFIVIHQVYELWFKQILWELDHAVALLDADGSVRAQHTLTRVLRILKVLVGQLDVLETMTPLEFLTFRDRLDSASGFQSSQFRELEVLIGLADHDLVARALDGDPSPGRRRLQERVGQPTMWDVLVAHLRRAGHEADPGDDASVRSMLVDVYRGDPVSAELCERFVDLDEGLQEWRYRHVKMVQRTIGTRSGTGGSAGAEYLVSTIRSAFPLLWAIRTEL